MMTDFGDRARVALLMLASSLVLAACGQTGPLYLPDREDGAVVQAPSPAPRTEPASEEPDKKKEEEPR